MVQNDLLSLRYLSTAETKQAFTPEPLSSVSDCGTWISVPYDWKANWSFLISVFNLQFCPLVLVAAVIFYFKQTFQLKLSFKVPWLNFYGYALKQWHSVILLQRSAILLFKNVIFLRVYDARCEVEDASSYVGGFTVFRCLFKCNVIYAWDLSKNVFLCSFFHCDISILSNS